MNERRPRRRPGENREQLLKAGLTEFGLHGYHGASTAAIARRAGVPQPHVYASFRTKQDLFEACAERALDQLAETTGAAAADTERAPDQLADVPGASVADAGASVADAERFLLQLIAALADPEAAGTLSALRTRLAEAFTRSEVHTALTRAADRILDAGE